MRDFDRDIFLGKNTVPIVNDTGKDSRKPFLSKGILKAYTDQEVEVHFVVDGDGMPEKWRNQFSKYVENKVILHQLTRHEIENYLFDPVLIERALKLKYPQKVGDIPSVEDIKDILLQCMQHTINYGYTYKDAIRDRLQKLVSLSPEKEIVLAGEKKKERDKHYSWTDVEQEARSITKSYANLDFDQLVLVAAGKETLSELNKRLTKEKKMCLSQKDILKCLEVNDIPGEIKHLLPQLRSKAADPLPDKSQK